MTGGPERPPLVVLESVPAPRPTTNPYLVQLLASFPDDVRAVTFSWRTALVGRYDVFHVHWPENLARAASPLRRLVRALLTAAFLVRLTVRRTPVVRTLHNTAPHEPGGRLERFLLAWVDRRTAAWVRLNEHTPVPGDGVVVTVPHGHYRDWFAAYPCPAAEPGRFVFFGLVRPYKGVETLVDAFTRSSGDDLSLRVVGRAADDTVARDLQDAAGRDPRISLRLEHVDDRGVVDEVGRAEVVVLPYRALHNSGAALLALSLGRPVLLPEGPTATALVDELGPEWVTTFAGEISPVDLRTALDRLRAAERTADGPDLSARQWPEAGEAHAAVFRRVVRR